MPAESFLANNNNGLDYVSKFKEILKLNGITDEVSEVVVKDAGLKGEGFASKTQCVIVKYTDPDKEPLNLFIKVHSDSEVHTEMLTEFKAFEKEARFLTEYVPAAKEFCESKGLKGFIDFYPKCYYGDEAMIVMENLKLQGYTLLEKLERQNLQEALCALKTLANHHAISYAMMKDMGGSDIFFQRFRHLDLEGFRAKNILSVLNDTCANAMKSNLKILETNDVDGAKDVANTLRTFLGVSFEKLTEALIFEATENEILSLGHGDYWNNNMMFLKDENDKFVGHKAIDFQVTRYSSPAIDLSYFFFTSVKHEVRQEHLRDLLESYLCTFKRTCKDLGHPVDLTYEQLHEEYRKRFTFGFWCAFTFLIGPSVAAIKDMDIDSMKDMSDWADSINMLVKKWLDKNPEKGKVYAEEIVSIFREYEKLKM